MKKSKLLLLLSAILCVALLLVACGDQEEEDNHELLGYFVLDDGTKVLYTDVSEIEGEIIDFDEDEDLVVTRETDVDTLDNVVETYKVINIMSGEVLFETSNKYPVGAEDDDVKNYTTVDVDLDYPVITVEATKTVCPGSDDEDHEHDDDETKTYSYYLAKKDAEPIAEDVAEEDQADGVDILGNLYVFSVNGETNYFNKDLVAVRTEPAVVTDNNYYMNVYEYDGYLYTQSSTEVTVLDRNGVVCASFSIDDDGKTYYNYFVLNNGNVLIQVSKEAEDGEEYSYEYMGQKATIKSYIMDYKTGALTELALDFVVANLESAYDAEFDEWNYFPFELAEGKENQAFIQKIENKKPADKYSYVVLDNNANIQYTVKDEALNSNIFEAEAIMADRYVIPMYVGNGYYENLYDLDGNLIATISSEYEVVKEHIVTEYAVYDKNMQQVYSFVENGAYTEIVAMANNLFLAKNPLAMDDGYEAYVFDFEAKAPVLVADGISAYFIGEVLEGDGAVYCVNDLATDLYNVYNEDGTLVFSTEYEPVIYEFEKAVILTLIGEDNNYNPVYYNFLLK